MSHCESSQAGVDRGFLRRQWPGEISRVYACEYVGPGRDIRKQGRCCLARYPQLYSRIGFAHHYRTLSTEELTFVLANRWQELGLTIDPHDFTGAEAIAAVARISNFRLIQRLFTQIMRIRDVNQLNSITKEVVEAARETLLIGTCTRPRQISPRNTRRIAQRITGHEGLFWRRTG
ncbi:hypothetical protein M1D93_09470 [Arthrobacter sp. Z1-9]